MTVLYSPVTGSHSMVVKSSGEFFCIFSTLSSFLYIEKKLTGKFYILKDVELPIGASLLHDVSFDTATGEFGLYIKLTKSASETPAVDVIIK